MISEPLPWLELNLLESGWCFLVILTAAVIRGYSGFGFSALTVAGLTLILPPAEVIPIAFLLEIGASIHMLPLVWKDIDWKRLRWLTMGMLIATPIGVYLLSILPEIPTRWLVLSLIFIASLLLLKGYQLKEASSGKNLTFGVGLLSGWVNGTTAVGGLPVLLFLLSTSTGASISRASLVAFFFLSDITALASSGLNDLIEYSSCKGILTFIDPFDSLYLSLASTHASFGYESQALVLSLESNLPTCSIVPPWAPLCRLPHRNILHLRDEVLSSLPSA